MLIEIPTLISTYIFSRKNILAVGKNEVTELQDAKRIPSSKFKKLLTKLNQIIH